MTRFRSRAAILLVLAFLAGGCTTNAATGKRHLMLLSRAEEEQIGAEAAPQFTAEYGGAVRDAQLQRYVASVGQSMAGFTEDYFPELNWEFTLLASDAVNAFALPGGKVFITRGLASRFTNEAQLAGTLGHEIGHVTAQHANRQMSKDIGFGLVLTGASIAVASAGSDSSVAEYGQYAVPALTVGGSLVLLRFGRDEEHEADELGLRYMTRAGYDPHALLDVMKVLESTSTGRTFEWLSTHPYPESRLETIEERLRTEYAGTTGRLDADRYQRKCLDRIARLAMGR